MTQELLVGTRKGLFTLKKSSGAWSITRDAFLGVPVTMTLRDPRDGVIYAALRHGHFGAKLHRSDDGGKAWIEIACPAFPLAEGAEDKPSVDTIWALEAAGDDMPGAIFAGTMPAGVFRSDDRGATWQLNKALDERPEKKEWFGGGNDFPGLHSISIHPADSRRMLIGISCGGVWATDDAGETWRQSSKGLWAAFMPPDRREDPNIQDVHRLARCRDHPEHLWVQHHNAQFRSSNGAALWDTISETFGFGVAAHPKDPATAWFVPAEKDEMRIPHNGEFCVLKTSDGGKSFRRITAGLPPKPCYDLILRHALDVDASGEVLAFGSTTGNLWLSEDSGESWQSVSHHLPPIYALRFAA